MTSTATNRPPNPACRVCGGEASGFHYGVDSCEGCKGFFRRCLTQGLTNRCTNDEKCEITPVSRNSCQFCRLKKCKMVGMSKEGSRLGRRPKRLKQCQGQTNDSLPPPPIQQPSNESASRYNRMYSNSSIATTLSLQSTEFPDNYSHYHFQQISTVPRLSVAGYQRVIKSEPEEQFLYSDHDSLNSMAKSRDHFKNSTSTNGRLSFDEKFSSNFHLVSSKNDGQHGSVHVKQEVQNCDNSLRSNYGSLENLSRETGMQSSSAWDKNGFQLTNSSSSEHLEEGEIPIRMVIGAGRTGADRKSSAWLSLDSSPHPSGLTTDHWGVSGAANREDVLSLKKSGRSAAMFLQSNFQNDIQERRTCHTFSNSEESSGVVVKTESMTSDDDENSSIESGFLKSFPRHSDNHSFSLCNPTAVNSNALESSHYSALPAVNLEMNGRSFFSDSSFKPASSADPTDHGRSQVAVDNHHRMKSANAFAEENLCGGLARGLSSLTLREVKGPIPQGKLELIGQVIETITTAHSSTCPYTGGKICEGLERFEEARKTGQHSDLNPNEVWKHFVDNMTPVIQRVVKFSKRLPGFCEISQEDQISLIKQGSFEVILIRYTKLFRDDSMFVPDMTILVPKDVIEKMPLGDFFQEQLKFASAFNKLELTDDEVGILSSIMIVCPDRVGLQNIKAIEQLNLLFLQSLYIHMQRTRPDSYDDFFDKAIEVLPKIRRINEIHSIKVSDIKLSPSPEVSFPPLHEEVFDETLC